LRPFLPLLASLLVSLAPAAAEAAQELRLNPIVDGAIVGGFAAVRLGLPLLARDAPLRTDPYRDPPGGLDGIAPLRLDSRFLGASDVVRWTALGLGAAAAAADGVAGDRLVVNAVIFAEAWLLNSALTDAAKQLSLRPRPYAYTAPQGRPDDTASFFSGHASSTAVAAFTAARLLDLQNDFPTWARIGLYGGATALSLGVGALRVAGGMHCPPDVLAGAAVGAAIGVILPSLHATWGWSPSFFSGGPNETVIGGISGTF
jgi:membrane-associated phospholipid phosphatase